jgi:hypothetical protein
MARSQENVTEANGTAIDFASLPDSTIYMMVDGYVGFLPFERHEALTNEQNVALNEGRKQIALRKAQTVARQAQKDGRDVREAINAFLAGFNPSADTEFQTLAVRRMELGRELLAERLEATGKGAVAEQVRAGKPVIDPRTKADILPGFMGKYAGEINSRLGDWANTRHETKRRGTGGAVELSLGESGFDDL